MIVNLNLHWSEFVETMRRFDLLLQSTVRKDTSGDDALCSFENLSD